jgi:iron(III) transport system substrate-binding protein
MKRSMLVAFAIVLCLAVATPVAFAQSAKTLSGRLVLYTGNGTEITDPLLAGFKKAYPAIQVEIVKAGSGELLARIRAEKDNPGGDILWGGEPLIFETDAALFEPWDSPSDKAMIRQDPKKIWHLWSFMAQAILVNTNLLKNPADWPKTIKELADPKWRKYGKIALADPNKSGTGATLVNGFASIYDWDFVEKLLRNCEISPGSDAMFAAVRDGADPIGFMNEDLGAKWEQMGLPVKMIFPADGITNTLDASAIIAGAKDRDNARAFIDWLGSKESHLILRDPILRRSCRTDMAPPPGLIDLSKYKIAAMANRTREEIETNFNDRLEKARASQ